MIKNWKKLVFKYLSFNFNREGNYKEHTKELQKEVQQKRLEAQEKTVEEGFQKKNDDVYLSSKKRDETQGLIGRLEVGKVKLDYIKWV